MQGYVERGEVAGVESLLWRHGEIGCFEPLGLRDKAAQLPMQRDTLFRIASMTKAVASAAIMMLIEEDRLALARRRLLSEIAPSCRRAKKRCSGPNVRRRVRK